MVPGVKADAVVEGAMMTGEDGRDGRNVEHIVEDADGLQ